MFIYQTFISLIRYTVYYILYTGNGISSKKWPCYRKIYQKKPVPI